MEVTQVGVDKGDEDQEVEVSGTGFFWLHCNLRDLSSLIKDRTHTPCGGSVES